MATERNFRVKMLYHPTLHVPDLEEAEDFYSRVFGRSSTNLSAIMPVPPAPGHSVDHSTLTPISDVFLDSLDPTLYLTGGVQRFPDVTRAHLKTPGGWFVEGVKELYKELRAQGFVLVDARGETLEAEEWAGGMSPFYTREDDVGLRLPFFEVFPFPLDSRTQEGWTIPKADDPLGIEYASHHTVLTSRPKRALKLAVDVLGGEVIRTGRDDLRGASGPYVRLADAVFHFAVPDPGSDAAADDSENDLLDTYHAITWKVLDMEKTAKHLESEGVRIARQSDTALITDPASSLGVPWGFTTADVAGGVR